MIWITCAALTVALAAVASTGALVRSLTRQHARERDLILDKLLHLAGATWTPPPREEQPERERVHTFAAPEQVPDHYFE